MRALAGRCPAVPPRGQSAAASVGVGPPPCRPGRLGVVSVPPRSPREIAVAVVTVDQWSHCEKPVPPPANQLPKMLRTLFSATLLVGALAGSTMAQAPDAGCAVPSRSPGCGEPRTKCPQSRPSATSDVGTYLNGRAARRFPGTLLRLLVTGFLVLAGSN